MSTNEEAIGVHQTVHGYRDGHELLSSSLPLTSATRRIMLALSDLSGDGNPRNFDEYLTGYPLEEAGFYAFARTWYAHEMKRPGCVWTHTLLLAFDDLRRIEDLGTLRSVFRRPEQGRVPASLSMIRHPIEPGSDRLLRLDGAAYEIVIRLYGQELPVLIFAESADQYEDTVIEVWNQQWKRLRSKFAFCTGALEPRSLEKRPLDLQVIPQQRERKTLRLTDKFSVISAEGLVRSTEFVGRLREALAQVTPIEEEVLRIRVKIGEGPEHLLREVGEPPAEGGPLPLWCDVIIQDLVHRNRALHTFIDQYGVDVEPRRTAYRHLIECWTLIETLDGAVTSLRDLTRALAKAFPDSGDARELKRAVLGCNTIVRAAREADLVQELLTLPEASAFDAQNLDLSARVQRLFRDGQRWRPSAIAWLLTAEGLNEIGREWSHSVLESLTVEDLTGVFTEDRELFCRLLTERPALAKQDHLWKQPRELLRAAVKTLPTIKDESQFQEIITAIVVANASGLVPGLVQELGSRVLVNVLTGINANRRKLNDLDEWQWAAQLRGYDAEILNWLGSTEQPEPWTLAFAVGVLSPYSNAVANTSNSTFSRHLTQTQASTSDGWVTEYAAFCLAIGLRNFNGDAAQLAVLAFEAVHQAALRSKVSRRAWQWLGPNLPRSGWFAFEDWDDAEKLRRALVDAFLRNGWNPSFLHDATADEQTRGWIIRYCNSFPNGQKLLQRAGLS